MNEHELEELRRKLRKAYKNYTFYRGHIESSGWYGDWTAQFKQMEEQALGGLGKEVDEIMRKLGYDKWLDEDVTYQIRMLEEKGKNKERRRE
jgi:hypothetical protein